MNSKTFNYSNVRNILRRSSELIELSEQLKNQAVVEDADRLLAVSKTLINSLYLTFNPPAVAETLEVPAE